MLNKSLFSSIAIVITLIAFLPYIRAIFKSAIRPHVFSWIIWGTTTFVVFFAQLQGHAGVGAWPIGVSGGISILIAILAYFKRADISITKTDWLFFVAAMSSLPIWYFTADPLWAVVILTTVDLLGFGPSIRKAWIAPYSESMLFFFWFALRNLIVILALEYYSLTTILFPAVIAGACILLVGLLLYRRQIDKR